MLTLCLDIGGTKIAAGLADPAGTLVHTAQRPTPAYGGAEQVWAAVAEMIADALGVAGARSVVWGSPRPVLSTYTAAASARSTSDPGAAFRCGIGSPPRSRGFRCGWGVTGCAWRSASTGWEPDGVRAFCWVWWCPPGWAAGWCSTAPLSRPHRQRRSRRPRGGGSGWLAVPVRGRGCVETIASGPSLARWARANGWSAPPGAGAKELAEAAGAGDPVALRAFRRGAAALAAMIASVGAVCDLDLAVIGGGVAKSGRLLFEPLRAALADHARLDFLAGLRVVPAELGGAAGLVGAARLAAIA